MSKLNGNEESNDIIVNIEDDDIVKFERDGFILKPNVLGENLCQALREEFVRLFKGEFDKNTYPDEWYWREEISKPDATRHMSNAWKASRLIERIALNPVFGGIAARLGNWKRSRLAMDTIWWKPPGARPIAFHQDTSFMDCFTPKHTITIWVVLTPTEKEVGTLEYAPGSHKWPLSPQPDHFHAPEDYCLPLRLAAKNAGIAVAETVPVDLSIGSIAIHSGEIWHGSGFNKSLVKERMSIGLHYMPDYAKFNKTGYGYIFRRYQMDGLSHLHDGFFPVI